MINVCVVNPNYYRSSGVTISIRRIFENLGAADITQYFVDCDYGDEQTDTSWIPAGRLATFRLMTLNVMAFPRECVAFLHWIKANDIRVVHVHHRRLAVILGWLRLFGGYRLIYTGNLTYSYEFLFWLFSPKVATGVTKSVIENIKRTTRTKILHLISNGVTFPAQCPQFDAAAVMNTAICIGRLDTVKGHDNLLQAWRILFDRGHQYRLLLVGEGPLREALHAQAKALQIDHAVEFLGFRKNVVAEIERSLFAVLPSRVEGQAIVTIEAATRGRASLVTDVDGSRDCVPLEHALPNLLKFGDVVALADALEIWFSQPAAAVSEGKLFFDYLRRSSSSEFVAGKYRALYAQVAAQ
jgi:glycosyltransferase involved in cell wall biosynthesis